MHDLRGKWCFLFDIQRRLFLFEFYIAALANRWGVVLYISDENLLSGLDVSMSLLKVML